MLRAVRVQIFPCQSMSIDRPRIEGASLCRWLALARRFTSNLSAQNPGVNRGGSDSQRHEAGSQATGWAAPQQAAALLGGGCGGHRGKKELKRAEQRCPHRLVSGRARTAAAALATDPDGRRTDALGHIFAAGDIPCGSAPLQRGSGYGNGSRSVASLAMARRLQGRCARAWR